MDLKCEGQPDVGIDTLQWIHTYKTAALLKAAVCCGATLAGASDFWSQMRLALLDAFATANTAFDGWACPKDLTEEDVGKFAEGVFHGRLDGAHHPACRLPAQHLPPDAMQQ